MTSRQKGKEEKGSYFQLVALRKEDIETEKVKDRIQTLEAELDRLVKSVSALEQNSEEKVV